MDISVIVPLYNEEESLQELYQWIKRVMHENDFTWELIFVDDGSKDKSWKVIESIAKEDSRVVGLKFRRNYGKSAALNCGFEMAKGEVVITMDADLQDSPDEIPALYKMIKEEDFDLVSGWKKKRHDPITKTIPTKLYNWAARRVSKIKLHDFNCGIKAYKHELVKNIEVYGEMHRYIPVIAKWAGFSKIGEKVVVHQKRKFGSSKFGMSRFINGFLDLISITFVGKFGKKPMHLFGTLGFFLFFIGFIIACYLAYAKFFMHGYKMTTRPLFYFGLLSMIIGTQLFLTGFIAEMIARNSADRNRYHIESVLNSEPIN